MSNFLQMLKKARKDLIDAGMSYRDVSELITNGQVSFDTSLDDQAEQMKWKLKKLGLKVDITTTESSHYNRESHKMWVRL